MKTPLSITAFLSVSLVLAEEPAPPVRIKSGTWEFDYQSGTQHYWNDVEVMLPGLLKLSCADLVTVQQSSTNNRPDALVATTNVIIEITRPPSKPGDAPLVLKVYGDRAVYTATNELVTLTGVDPRIVAPQGTTRGRVITYDLGTGKIRATGGHLSELNLDVVRAMRRTNAPTANPSPATAAPKEGK
jgi:lipopolysaccharide transport protein LptA